MSATEEEQEWLDGMIEQMGQQRMEPKEKNEIP